MAAPHRLCSRQYDQCRNRYRWLYAADDGLSAALVPQLAGRRCGQHWLRCSPDAALWCHGDGGEHRPGYLRAQFHARAPGAYLSQDVPVAFGYSEAHRGRTDKQRTNWWGVVPALCQSHTEFCETGSCHLIHTTVIDTRFPRNLRLATHEV